MVYDNLADANRVIESQESTLKFIREENETLKKRVNFWFDYVNDTDPDKASEMIDQQP